MVMHPIVLGPEFDNVPDDTEETLVGSHLHQGAIVTAFDGLRICARRRDLPWFVARHGCTTPGRCRDKRTGSAGHHHS